MKSLILFILIATVFISYHLVDGEKGKNVREEAKRRQKEARKEFKKMKTNNQLDRKIGNAIMRADKKGGKLAIQRKGQYFQMKIKEIIEKRPRDKMVNF